MSRVELVDDEIDLWIATLPDRLDVAKKKLEGGEIYPLLIDI